MTSLERRIELLETAVMSIQKRVERLPCDHVEFPIDEEYVLDEDDFEVQVNICRNCGERV